MHSARPENLRWILGPAMRKEGSHFGKLSSDLQASCGVQSPLPPPPNKQASKQINVKEEKTKPNKPKERKEKQRPDLEAATEFDPKLTR